MAAYGDYRPVPDRKDVDAVLIATADHWHSQITVDACAAGKDIYVEKPLSNTIATQRMLWQRARKISVWCRLTAAQLASLP